MKRIVFVGLAAAALVVALVVSFDSRRGTGDAEPLQEKGNDRRIVDVAQRKPVSQETVQSAAAQEGPAPDAAKEGQTASESEQPQTAEEKAAAAEEAKVEAFDNLTDKWLEPKKSGVSMKDVADFVAAFRAVPKSRKDECIHRALNLIPDDNVMLLAGVLMDKSEDREIVETVFSDILNRDEEVKKPIMQQIFADKSHPCWADTAWILDVTGELPSKK